MLLTAAAKWGDRDLDVAVFPYPAKPCLAACFLEEKGNPWPGGAGRGVCVHEDGGAEAGAAGGTGEKGAARGMLLGIFNLLPGFSVSAVPEPGNVPRQKLH